MPTSGQTRKPPGSATGRAGATPRAVRGKARATPAVAAAVAVPEPAAAPVRPVAPVGAPARGAARAPVDDSATAAPPHSAGLDRYDVAILVELQRDARLSNAELATRIGLSPAPTWRRVRWLEAQGYIVGYRAELDRRRLGLGVLAFVRVDADRNTGAATRELEEAIRRLPEVIACHYISGAGTFELEVVATDLDAFSRFSIETLLNLPHVKDIHTSFSLGEVKAGGALPLQHLPGPGRR